MVDWMSPATIAANADAFAKLQHTLLGLYIWEWFTSLDFDWQFITRKKPFRWPLVFYFLNRYCLLFAQIGIAIALNVKTEVDCQALYTFNQCVGNATIGLASINLSLRTIAVWSQAWYIWAPLVAIILGHWSLLLHGILLKATWVPEVGCMITETNSTLLAVTFIYTMSFDFLVLCLTAYKLFNPASGRSRLVELIFNDGLIYFLVAFLANLVATVFMLLNLNPVMSIMANVPAAIAATIVACRIVRRLSRFTSTGPERFAASTQNSTLAFRSQAASHVRPPKLSSKVVMNEGVDVHVQMETFESPPDKYSEYDAAGNVRRGVEAFDPESQAISKEFKRPPY
ncbi:hypothetical protein FA15DRAFT_667769 [Coprinopsis marcescibilis]|uniref:Transmembrane protein n=1 Tax=Coprinopsis marcescibilis TaxID=230819 RepID=A0A5C3L099_COPMA|nr:hypothetical protein FA15DRAFT_667769 [Coprinopsis marcescibilis]